MTRNFCTLLTLFVLNSTLLAKSPAPIAQDKPLIQMAILLDTSGSMEGLIDQARTQLWTVVNELARTKRAGQTPQLQVALYQYGNDGINPEEHWIQLILPFTDDLDAISEKLFALKTNGGQEYCGATIEAALKQLTWSDRTDAYKTIFIAGNEPFTQGPIDFHQPCADAKAKKIVVNTIHCGPEGAGVQSGWRDGAVLAGGMYLAIDTNTPVVAIAAPQDEELARLSTDLNGTYIPYGQLGSTNAQRQVAADAAAASQPAIAAPVLRAVAKSSALYTNGAWDLVDATKDNKDKLNEIKEADLPESMRKMTPEERKAYVEQQAQKRSKIQEKIQELSQQREQFVAEKRREQATTQPTLDAAIVTAVRQQMNGN